MLAPLLAAHAPLLAEGLRDPVLHRFIPTEPLPEEALQARFARLEGRRSPDGKERWWNWAVRLRSGHPWTGLCEATVHADGSATIAYFVFTAFAGQRFGQEQVRLMLGHLAAAGVHQIRAQVDTRNVASFTLLERLGFTRTATLIGADHFKGASSDEHHYALILP